MKIIVNGYTITEHMKLKRSYNIDIKELMELDRTIGRLKRNRKRYMRLVTLLALIISSTTLQVFAAGGIVDMTLDLYAILKDACYAICLLGTATESIKCVVSGTVDQLGKVAVKYIAFALMIKFLPQAVDMIFKLGGR